ncbi:hypothetical protein NLJ89_g10721 [Agrocybe chaxingu]|uniref:Integrase catalytic domain-containing protein n=1 Tax=Agrocybe chaxingu TaxID=84603 RepID=A0A9W8MQN1_9AGAR|nr:hypothetical protein NLJ89_g10721 [Agrocybe chaxingu]
MGRSSTVLKLRDCLHAPDACVNLLSVGRFVSKGIGCFFADKKVVISKGGVALGQGPMVGNVFVIDVEFLRPPTPVSDGIPKPMPDVACFSSVAVTLDLWHHRLGHAGEGATRSLLKSTTGVSFSPTDALSKCEPCIIGKHARSPAPSSVGPKTTKLLELIHCDLCGPFPVETPHGKRYFIIFLDDFSNVVNVQLLATKDQAFDAWLLVQAKWENKLGLKVGRFRCDGGGELEGKDQKFVQQLQERGIERDVTPPYEHWKNGKAERLSMTYWGEAALTAGYLHNLTITSTLPSGVTPFEMFHGRRPDVSHLRVWGVRCFAQVPVEMQKKLGPKSRECLFMGYPPSQRGYRVRDLQTHHFFSSGSVIFDENIPYHALHEVPSTPMDYSSLPFPSSVLDNVASPPECEHNLDNAPQPSTPVAPSLPAPAPPPTPTHSSVLDRPVQVRTLTKAGKAYADQMEAARVHLLKVREAASARKDERIRIEREAEGLREAGPGDDVESDFTCLCRDGLFDTPLSESGTSADVTAASLDVEDYLQRDIDARYEAVFLSIRSDVRRDPRAASYDMSVPPANHREAMLRPDADEWRRVEQKELDMLKSMGVYVEEMLPEGRKAIGCRWVHEFKVGEGGDRIYKARCIAQGFSQVPFVDYDATFAPVAKAVSIRFVAVYSALLGWDLECFDATRAFLWGDLSRLIFMRCPDGYIPSIAGAVWRLLKSLYGLKQASLIWYKLLRKVLEALGFVRSEFDHALFVFKRVWSNTDVHCLLAMHVDDGLSGCNFTPFLTFIKGEIGKAFGIKDLGPVTMFLGVQFERNLQTCELWIHQEAYTDVLLAEYGLTDCNPVSTPLDPIHPLGRESDVPLDVPDLVRSYQCLVGSLLFLQSCSRPDISFAVLLLSQHCSSPLPRHFAAARRVLRYLKGTRTHRLHYGGAQQTVPIAGLSDADWAGEKGTNRASTSGFVWSLAGGPISWSAKKQTCIALSTTEAEYIALTRAVQEGIWIRQSLLALHLHCPNPLVIATDNHGARSLSENDSDHSRAKHIDIRYHFIRSHVDNQSFTIAFTPGVINTADIFTKPLSRVIFQSHVERLGLAPR